MTGAETGKRGPAGDAGPAGGTVDDAACAVALAGLPGAGPVSLTQMLVEAGGPAAAWAAVCAGDQVRPPGRRGSPPATPWAVAARRVDVVAAWETCRAGGIAVTWLGASTYPAALAGDPLPPPILFWRGDLAGVGGRRVALIGTRRCTPDGAATAFELGRDLVDAGVCVVSGLALGIDGAAHRGALASSGPGTTVGVAASGVDRPYPPRHAGLWQEVVERGAVVSETAPGRPAQAWRFPARNRIIAGLAEVVVVVESHAGGGSMLTVEAALERGIEVCAVPGPVRSPASAGTNQLLRDGPAPVRGAQDVLDALGDFRPAPAIRPIRPDRRAQARAAPAGSGRDGPAPVERDASAGPPQPPVPARLRAVLDAVGWRPTSLNTVVGRSGLGVGPASAALDELRALGAVTEERGWWQRWSRPT